MLLRLWVAVRLTTRSMSIIGDETLGMPPDILDETSPIHGSIPIPPVMGAQLDFILIQQIEGPLRDRVLEALQKVVLSNKRTSWFTIYLCTFVLLHNCALITKHDHGYARKHGMQVSELLPFSKHLLFLIRHIPCYASSVTPQKFPTYSTTFLESQA
jgi:hypothetical protein